jgi:hypothetical protein
LRTPAPIHIDADQCIGVGQIGARVPYDDIVMHALDGENPVRGVGWGQADHRRVLGAGDHHPEALGPQQGHGVELDSQIDRRLIDLLSREGRSDPARIDPTVTGVEEDRLMVVARGGRIGHTGACGERSRVEGCGGARGVTQVDRGRGPPSQVSPESRKYQPRRHQDAQQRDQDDGPGQEPTRSGTGAVGHER